MELEFKEWPKIPRFYGAQVTVSEKIDGTNGVIAIAAKEDGSMEFKVGSRSRWITPSDDNFGFAKWAYENSDEIIKLLGEGYHYGEWWGQGIQRGYNMDKKVFSLFNVGRWSHLTINDICDVVPYFTIELRDVEMDAEGKHLAGSFDHIYNLAMDTFLKESMASKRYGKEFNNPEGFMMYHDRLKSYFKVPVTKETKVKEEPSPVVTQDATVNG